MISYKEYLKACESKSEWEKDRSNIRAERAKVKEVFSLLSAPDNWVDHLKYGVRSISLKISIEREVVKRSSFYLEAKGNRWLMNNLNKKVNILCQQRAGRRKELYRELKNQGKLETINKCGIK